MNVTRRPSSADILPQDEWLHEHKSKFDRQKLSRAERLRRYRDYASSSSNRAVNPRTEIPRRLPSGHQKKSADSEVTALMHAMCDPFTACSPEGYLPRIPDACSRDTGVYKFHYNVDVYSDANGRAFFFLDTSPFRATCTSSIDSNVNAGAPDDASFIAQAEYNSYLVEAGRLSNGVGAMPPWSSNSWMIPVVLTANETLGPPTPGYPIAQSSVGFQPAIGYSSLWDIAQAWRPICAGMRFKNTGKVLDREGNVAVARWPGALGAPTSANQLLVVQGSSTTSTTLAGYQGLGPNFETVQTLPTAKVVPLCEGFTAVWTPESAVGQAEWRPIHPKPMCTTASIQGITEYSDEGATGVFILPDPCNGTPQRYEALIDRVMTQNANVVCTGAGIDPGQTGYNQGLYFQNFSSTLPTDQAHTSYTMRDILKGFNESDMLVDNTALIACFEGCEAQTLLGTMEVVLGVEYIADSRIVTTGNGPALGSVSLTKSKQLDVHHATITAMQKVPAVVSGAVSVAESIAGAVPKVAAAASAVAPYFEAALSALGALLL